MLGRMCGVCMCMCVCVCGVCLHGLNAKHNEMQHHIPQEVRFCIKQKLICVDAKFYFCRLRVWCVMVRCVRCESESMRVRLKYKCACTRIKSSVVWVVCVWCESGICANLDVRHTKSDDYKLSILSHLKHRRNHTKPCVRVPSSERENKKKEGDRLFCKRDTGVHCKGEKSTGKKICTNKIRE